MNINNSNPKYATIRGWILSLLLIIPTFAMSQTGDLIRSTPELEGIPSTQVKAFFDSLMSIRTTQIHSCIVMRHGHVIGEIYPTPWKAEYQHTMYSASKTFTAAAVGMLVGDSLITIQDSIYTYLRDYYPEVPSDTLLNITIRDLLTMQSGIPVDTRMRTVEKEWLRVYLSQAPRALPGELFAYDSIVTYMLSAIVQKVTGKTLFQFLKERLFNPMHITNVSWEESPEGITCGGWGLYIQPESMAKFGQLLLRQGWWNGISLIPEDWVMQMMMPQSVTGNYGFQMWQCDYPGWAQVNGAYGQLIFVIPHSDIVISMTQCCNGKNPVQKYINNLLVQNCHDEALPVNTTALQALREATYQLPAVKGKSNSRHHARSFRVSLAQNFLGWERVNIRIDLKGVALDVTDTDGKNYTIRCGYNRWEESRISGKPYCPRKFQNNFSNLPSKWRVAASYGWQGEEILAVRLHFVDFLTSCDINFRLHGATLDFVEKMQDSGRTAVTRGWKL